MRNVSVQSVRTNEMAKLRGRLSSSVAWQCSSDVKGRLATASAEPDDRRSCLSSPDWPTALSDSSPDFKGAPQACPALQCALLVSQGEGIVCPQPECMCQACRGSQPSSFCHLQCSSCCEQHHSGWWLLCSGNVVKIALPTSQGHSAWRAVLTAHRCLTMAYSTRPGLRSPQQWQKAYLQNLLVQLPLQHMLAHHS